MKLKIVVIILSFANFSVFANEYVKNTAFCRMTGDYTLFSQARRIALPKQINFQVEQTAISDEKKYTRVEIVGTNLIKAKKAVRGAIWNEIYIQFKNLKSHESIKVLAELGATDIPELDHGFRFKRLRFDRFTFSNGENTWFDPGTSWYRRHGGTIRSQIHFPLDERDGLSYHININCYEDVLSHR